MIKIIPEVQSTISYPTTPMPSKIFTKFSDKFLSNPADRQTRQQRQKHNHHGRVDNTRLCYGVQCQQHDWICSSGNLQTGLSVDSWDKSYIYTYSQVWIPHAPILPRHRDPEVQGDPSYHVYCVPCETNDKTMYWQWWPEKGALSGNWPKKELAHPGLQWTFWG